MCAMGFCESPVLNVVFGKAQGDIYGALGPASAIDAAEKASMNVALGKIFLRNVSHLLRH